LQSGDNIKAQDPK